MRRSAMLCVMLATAVSWAATVSAQSITIYTDRTQWENALNGRFLTEDFSDAVLNDGVSFVSTESGHINPALEAYAKPISRTTLWTTWFIPAISRFLSIPPHGARSKLYTNS